MASLRVRPAGSGGQVHAITPRSAGWQHVGFSLFQLSDGDAAGDRSADREICLVFVSGIGRVIVAGQEFGTIGGRMTPFEGKPWSVYVPPGADWSVVGRQECCLAVCSAPAGPGPDRVRVIAPEELETITRGAGTNTRYVTNILPETDSTAASLLVVEVITPGGHTSSYPPHKHDTDDLPRESLLDETYYHRLRPPQGFALQRVYTDDRSLDEALVIEDGDVTLVPRGYHPVAAVHGYDLYYLNVMAGPKRTWKFHNAAEHEWLLRA